MSATLFKPDEAGTLQVFPRIEGMMCGVQSVFSNHPRYRLNYVDGTHEDAECPELRPGDGLFRIVSAVQSKREAR